MRHSRMSGRRAAVLIAVHLLIIGHVIHWWVAGRTLTPVEPSEAMYTLNDGYLNAGFIFFALAIIATAIWGRFFCGWGCHLVAYQDLCAWLLTKVRIKPKPFRSRLLVFAPLALALYMFVWPSVYRWWIGAPRPRVTSHLTTTEFWATFPGVAIAIVTFALCGFAIVYFLGAKGFCTYACPYGGFFGLADQVAPGRILVTDACEHCGHCTAVCTSNVRVHEEVALYGMVVDPGCMKCMDCVSVCPNDALYFGFSRPSLGAKPVAPRRPTVFDFSLAEELLMVIVGLAALLIYRGLYDEIPLLLAMGIAAMTAFLVMKLIHVARRPQVRLQQLQLKRGWRLTRAGAVFVGAMAIWLLMSAHSAAVQLEAWRGQSQVARLRLGDDIWEPGKDWWSSASSDQRSRVESALSSLERADRWGVMRFPSVLRDLVWLYVARNDTAGAEQTVRRLIEAQPRRPEMHRGLASVLAKAGRPAEAEAAYRAALAVDPAYGVARDELSALLIARQRPEEAIAEYRAAIKVSPHDTQWPIKLGELLNRLGRYPEARAELSPAIERHPNSGRLRMLLGLAMLQGGDPSAALVQLRRAAELEPKTGDIQYALGYTLLTMGNATEALTHLRSAVEAKPGVALWHYNLAVASFMTGRPNDALPHIREAVRLSPDDPQAHGFLAVVLEELGDDPGATEARQKAASLSNRP